MKLVDSYGRKINYLRIGACPTIHGRLQTQLFGPYFSSFSTNSYGYYSQTSQNLFSNFWIFASTLIVGQAPSAYLVLRR